MISDDEAGITSANSGDWCGRINCGECHGSNEYTMSIAPYLILYYIKVKFSKCAYWYVCICKIHHYYNVFPIF